MAKLHSSLSPANNILLILALGAAVSLFLFVFRPHAPWALAVAGGIFGAIAGIMQHLGLKQCRDVLLSASSFIEVRSALNGTAWGRRFIRWLYFSKLALIAIALILVRQPLLAVVFAYFAGYCSLMFVREIITLRDTFLLQRLFGDLPNRE